jgi:hypothetical protein
MTGNISLACAALTVPIQTPVIWQTSFTNFSLLKNLPMSVTSEDIRAINNEYQRRYNERHPERVKAAHQRYYQKNRERILAYQNEYNHKKFGYKPKVRTGDQVAQQS